MARRYDPEDVVAVALTATISIVLLAIVADMILAAAVSPADRAVTLGSLAAIGTAIATGLARWIASHGHRGPDDD